MALWLNKHRNILAPGVVVLAGLTLLFASPNSFWERKSLDLLFLGREVLPGRDRPAYLKDVIVVAMDQESYDKLGQDLDAPWDRALHATLITNLVQAGAKAAAFDVVFQKDDEDAATQALIASVANAVGKGAPVVLGAMREVNETNQSVSLIPPFEGLREAASAFGRLDLRRDGDGVVRRPYVDRAFTNLAEALAAALSGQNPPDDERNQWIDYYGPAHTIPSIGYHEALENPGRLADKVVFVGQGKMTPRSDPSERPWKDSFQTPLTRGADGWFCGVEIHATRFLNIRKEDRIRQSSPWTQVFLVIGLGVLAGGLLPRFPLWAACAGGVVLGAVVWAGSVWVFASDGVWFPWFVVVAGELPLAVVLSCAPVCDVFISHRRASDATLAQTIRLGLKKDYGVKSFVDVNSEEAGKLGDILYAELDRAPNFLVVLSANMFDERDENAEDWVVRELERAESKDKTIIPILANGSDAESVRKACPERFRTRVDSVLNYAGVPWSIDKPDASLSDIVKKLRVGRRRSFW